MIINNFYHHCLRVLRDALERQCDETWRKSSFMFPFMYLLRQICRWTDSTHLNQKPQSPNPTVCWLVAPEHSSWFQWRTQWHNDSRLKGHLSAQARDCCACSILSSPGPPLVGSEWQGPGGRECTVPSLSSGWRCAPAACAWSSTLVPPPGDACRGSRSAVPAPVRPVSTPTREGEGGRGREGDEEAQKKWVMGGDRSGEEDVSTSGPIRWQNTNRNVTWCFWRPPLQCGLSLSLFLTWSSYSI